MSIFNSTAAELRAMGGVAAEHLARLGYDTANFDWLRVKADVIEFEFRLMDDFQRSAAYDDYYFVSFAYTIEVSDDGPTLLEQVRRMPNREQRELAVLQRKLASAANHDHKLVSERARAFAERIAEEARELGHLIEDQRDGA